MITGQGTYVGYRFSPRAECVKPLFEGVREATNQGFSHINVSLPHSLIAMKNISSGEDLKKKEILASVTLKTVYYLILFLSKSHCFNSLSIKKS